MKRLMAAAGLLFTLNNALADEPPDTAVATFGGGCFWCMEPPYDKLDGVIETTSGFMGGALANPSYRDVVSGGTAHVEVVQVRYDPSKVSYEKLLHVFWRNHDPLTDNRQFCDSGDMYRPVIFTHDEQQDRLARDSRQELAQSGRFDQPIVTSIEPAGPFYAAEEYHQGYYLKNPVRYRYYRWNCGRDQRLEALWGDEAGA